MPIELIYELDVPPGRLDEVKRLFFERYLPASAERGMHFAGAFITPPIELDDAPTTLVLRFELADESAVWAMKRHAAASSDVADFWKRIDEIVMARSRRFLAPAALESARVP